ncbi:LIC_13387 family protein [Conexibacter arvalis]|uniref:Uncharacterized protein n=1 Tax=Conexibacter arvalis TaxID=912552 RepID=A0A840II76_9ACTN|nr:hypothetical protein [Conexibacter arvalis]MBB4663873.1 hypothetical protein [Conexibacter arvalis]
MSAGAAQAWFVAGTIPLMAAGGGHALATLLDTVRLTFFAPADRSVVRAMEGSGVRLVRMFGVGGAKPSMWRMWLGIHLSHGIGAFTFGLLCLMLATHDFALIGEVGGLRPLTIAFPAVYLAISLRFWFYGPTLITAASTTCFTVSALLAR